MSSDGLYDSRSNMKQQVLFSEAPAVTRSGNHITVNVASASYNVSNRNVNMLSVFKDDIYRDAVVKLYGNVDQIFPRSSGMEHGPEVINFVNGMGHLSRVRVNGHDIKTDSKFFARSQDMMSEHRNIARKRIISYDNHRAVVTRSFPKVYKRGGSKSYVIPIGDLHKDMIISTSDIMLYTWGNIIGYGDSAIWYIGPHGVSKSESSNNGVDNGAFLMGDDIIGIAPGGESMGTNYMAIYSQKEWFKKEGVDQANFNPDRDYDKRNPETSSKYAECFVENTETPYRHLKLGELPKRLFLKRKDVKDIGEIFKPGPVRTDTIIFYLPYIPNYYNMWFKNADEGDKSSYQMPTQSQVVDAFQALEGFGSAKVQFHKKTPEESARYVGEYFKVTSPIDQTRKETIVNLKKMFSDDQLFDIFGNNWILKHAEEYCCGDPQKDNSWMELYVRDSIKSAERFYMIGKRTPPKPSPRLSQTIVETVAQGNTMRRMSDIENHSDLIKHKPI